VLALADILADADGDKLADGDGDQLADGDKLAEATIITPPNPLSPLSPLSPAIFHSIRMLNFPPAETGGRYSFR
jgi:hypothetical protein